MDFSTSPFGQTRPSVSIPDDAQIIFVSDMFPEDYVGGAELTTQALIDSSPYNVCKVHARDVSIDVLRLGHSKYWVFGNATQMDHNLIPTIVANLKYSILEYDYKFCRARSIEKHKLATGMDCDCHDQQIGKLVSAWFYGADQVWWMSERQKDVYLQRFPFLGERVSYVLSSVFGFETLAYLKKLRQDFRSEALTRTMTHPDLSRKGWIVLGSKSWIKGFEDAEKWCRDNGKEYEVVWDLPYEKVLEKLSRAEGFVYLPRGGDTCPRMVIEAKLLGCKLQLNDNVQHAQEDWFKDDDIEHIEQYLYGAHKVFWNATKEHMDYKPTISGYTTTLNCIKQQYPFEQCISSMLEFCDEVCVVDGGSTDGTWEKLIDFIMKEDGVALADLDDNERKSTIELSKAGAMAQSKRLRIKQVARDWNDPKFAVFDGLQKAEARAMCTKEYCWQMDSDEIVHESDYEKIKTLVRNLPKDIDLMALPVVEYWGGYDKVRIDVNPWKWRLSRNRPNITHGIPKELRTFDSQGRLCATGGTDGCDFIDKETFERIPFLSFYTEGTHNVRMGALSGNVLVKTEYERWFNMAVGELPSVFHYSWFNLPRKIRLYRDYWTRHWCVLRNEEFKDSAEQNMMFDVPWSQVTEEMIESRAKELSQIGGWVWHRKWKGEQTPWITCSKNPPKVMEGWK